MKKSLLLLFIAVMTMSCATKGYVLNGDIQGLEGKVYLALMQGKTPEIVDSTEAVNGKFEFKGILELPMLVQVQDAQKTVAAEFFLENSEITMSAVKGERSSLDVKGSKEQDLSIRCAEEISSSSMPDGKFLDKFFDENTKSIAAAYWFFRYRVPGLTTDEMRERIAKFDPSIKNSVYLKLIEKRIETLEQVAVGKPFVDFELADTTGKMIKLSDIAGKDKYVLLDFWAAWCPPCRAENPNVVENFKKYGDKGFTVFGVSLDKKREDWIAAIKKDELNWTNVSDLKFWSCEPAELYGVSSIPSNVLIAPDGRIIARNIRGEELGKTLEQLLSDKK